VKFDQELSTSYSSKLFERRTEKVARNPNLLFLAISLVVIALVASITAKTLDQPRSWVSLAKLAPLSEKQCLVASFMEELDMDYQLGHAEDELFVSPQDLWHLRSELRNQNLHYLLEPKSTKHFYFSDQDYVVTLEEQRLGQKLSAVLRESTQGRMIVWIKLKAANVEFEENNSLPRQVKKFKVAKLQVLIAVDEELCEGRELIEAACRRAVGIQESRDSFKLIARPWSKELHALYWKSQEKTPDM
jgi:hypothetical protein